MRELPQLIRFPKHFLEYESVARIACKRYAIIMRIQIIFVSGIILLLLLVFLDFNDK